MKACRGSIGQRSQAACRYDLRWYNASLAGAQAQERQVKTLGVERHFDRDLGIIEAPGSKILLLKAMLGTTCSRSPPGG